MKKILLLISILMFSSMSFSSDLNLKRCSYYNVSTYKTLDCINDNFAEISRALSTRRMQKCYGLNDKLDRHANKCIRRNLRIVRNQTSIMVRRCKRNDTGRILLRCVNKAFKKIQRAR